MPHCYQLHKHVHSHFRDHLPEDDHMEFVTQRKGVWGAWGCGLQVSEYRQTRGRCKGTLGGVIRLFLRNATDKVKKYPASLEFTPPYPTLHLSFSLFQPQEHLASLPSSLTCFSGPWAPINGTSWKMLMQAVFEQPAHFLARTDSLLKLLDFSEDW